MGFLIFVFAFVVLCENNQRRKNNKSNESVAKKKNASEFTAKLEETNRPVQVMKHQAKILFFPIYWIATTSEYVVLWCHLHVTR